jgi:hypothetical protein
LFLLLSPLRFGLLFSLNGLQLFFGLLWVFLTGFLDILRQVLPVQVELLLILVFLHLARLFVIVFIVFRVWIVFPHGRAW